MRGGRAVARRGTTLADLTARAEQVTAYLGGAAATAVMAACLAFAIMLVLRQAAASVDLPGRSVICGVTR